MDLDLLKPLTILAAADAHEATVTSASLPQKPHGSIQRRPTRVPLGAWEEAAAQSWGGRAAQVAAAETLMSIALKFRVSQVCPPTSFWWRQVDHDAKNTRDVLRAWAGALRRLALPQQHRRQYSARLPRQ